MRVGRRGKVPREARRRSGADGALGLATRLVYTTNLMNPSAPLEEADIQRLVLAAQGGDTEAFGRVYDHYFLSVYRYTAFRAPPEIVEDLVADIFVKAWEKLHQYRPQKDISFGAWVFRIARHTVIDAYRSQRHFEEVPEDMADPDRLNRAETRTQRNELLLIVRQAMAKLPRRYRDVLLLAYVAELPHSEIARVLRATEGSVRTLKFRALQKLSALLPPEFRGRNTP